MESKRELRLIAKDVRRSLDINVLSEKAVFEIRKSEEYRLSNNVLIFYPMKYELNLLPLIEDAKNFYLPRVNGKNMDICPYKQGDILNKSKFNIYEPVVEAVNDNVIDLVIAPALMVDKQGYRLGYGGGFYDRLFEKHPKIKSIVPIAKELVVGSLPVDAFDKRINVIIKC